MWSYHLQFTLCPLTKPHPLLTKPLPLPDVEGHDVSLLVEGAEVTNHLHVHALPTGRTLLLVWDILCV